MVMSDAFVVEVWGEPAGIVVEEGSAFRFHAIARPFFALDGAQFTTRGHARVAAARLQAENTQAIVAPESVFPQSRRPPQGSWNTSADHQSW